MTLALPKSVALQNARDISSVWIVIPAYNEGAVIADTVLHARTLFKHVVVINDGSSDDTAIAAERAGATVVNHPVNLGQGAALQTGIDFAIVRGANFVATFDADGQHCIDDVLTMFNYLQSENLDVVLGSRFLGNAIGISRLRRTVLWAAIIFTRLTTGLKLTDAHNGLRVFTSGSIAKISLYQNRMAHASEILEQIAKHKFAYAELGNTVRYTPYSLAKGQPSSNSVNILIDLFLGRLRK
jgi:glycosyltransferase involved in cell wall biosynthesis